MHHNLAAVPPGILDYIIVTISVIVLLVASWVFIRRIVKPGEDDAGHIKRRILDDDAGRPGDDT